eukprot:4080157-Amphidinium_carterae.2
MFASGCVVKNGFFDAAGSMDEAQSLFGQTAEDLARQKRRGRRLLWPLVRDGVETNGVVVQVAVFGPVLFCSYLILTCESSLLERCGGKGWVILVFALLLTQKDKMRRQSHSAPPDRRPLATHLF